MTYDIIINDAAAAAGVSSVGGELMPPAVADSVAAVYLNQFPKATTRRTMAAALDTVAGVIGVHRDAIAWHRISPAKYAAIRSTIIKTSKPATTNKCMAAIRGCVRLAWLDGIITGDTKDRIINATRGVSTHSNAAAGRRISASTYAAVIEATNDGSPAGVRDVAMLHVMRGGGLRRDEVASITTDAYDSEAGALRVIGKGDKPRVVYLPPAARLALSAWLAIRGTHSGALFVRITKASTITTHGISSQAVYDVVCRRMAAVGVSIRPHDLRRTYATHEASRGVPLPVIQRQLGHASLATTSIYMMHGEEEQRAAAAALEL